MYPNHSIGILSHASGTLVICTLLYLLPRILMAGVPPQDKEQQKSFPKYYLILQSAGYLGFVTAGIGRDSGRHQINLLLGYVPEEVSGVEIWQLSFKYDWHPSQDISLGAPEGNIRLEPFYIGISAIYGYHENLFTDEPDQYPNGYYPSTSLHYTLNIGAALKYGRHTFFLEYTALDAGIVAYIKNPEFFRDNYDYLGLEGIGSMAIGFKFAF